MTPDELRELAHLIALRLNPNALFGVKEVAALLGCSVNVFQARYRKRPGFPQPFPVRVEGTSGLHLKWRQGSVCDWVRKQDPATAKVGGRPRNRIDDEDQR